MRADDSAFSEGRGAYSTARVEAGRVRFVERHVDRLVTAAARLGLGDLVPEQVRRAFTELAEAAFAGGAGVVRMQVSRDGDGGTHLVGVPRALGAEPEAWSAIVFPLPHAGAVAGGLKVTSRLLLALASDAAREAGCDEALLLDGAGLLVEGARSNVVVVPGRGAPATPPLAAGAVAGVARGVVLERVPEIEERPVAGAELRGASEVVAVNAVRGARPVTRLDGAPVGAGTPGSWAARLAEALAYD